MGRELTRPNQARQVAALQGMGKEIAPRIQAANAPDPPNLAKRDLAGFDRALKYAEVVPQKRPNVHLETGLGGSGVSIIVDNNPIAAVRPGTTAGPAFAKAKRDLGS